MRQLGDALRDAGQPLAHAGALQAALATLSGAPAALLLCRQQKAKKLSNDCLLNVLNYLLNHQCKHCHCRR